MLDLNKYLVYLKKKNNYKEYEFYLQEINHMVDLT